MHSSEDAEVVARVRNGDAAAFEAVFRSYHARLCAFVHGYVSTPELAEEVVQELFLSIWKQRTSWSVRGSLRAYLYTAARNRALNALKHTRIEARTAAMADKPSNDTTISAEEQIEHEEAAQRVRQAMLRLPTRCRMVMVLRWHHELKNSEIAQALDISVKGVEQQLRRGLELLRRELSGE